MPVSYYFCSSNSGSKSKYHAVKPAMLKYYFIPYSSLQSLKFLLLPPVDIIQNRTSPKPEK